MFEDFLGEKNVKHGVFLCYVQEFLWFIEARIFCVAGFHWLPTYPSKLSYGIFLSINFGNTKLGKVCHNDV